MKHMAAITTEGQDAEFQRTSTEFLQLVREIHSELSQHVHLVQDYRSYGKSTYGVEKDAEISRMKVKIILEELRELRRFSEENLATLAD